MKRVQITQEAYRRLYETTVQQFPEPYTSSDQQMIWTDLSDEVLAHLDTYEMDSPSAAIIHMCKLVERIREFEEEHP